jgi:hypothetical protein
MNDATPLITRITKFPDVLALAAVLMVLSALMLWLVDVDRMVVLAVAGVAVLDALMWLTFRTLARRKAAQEAPTSPGVTSS